MSAIKDNLSLGEQKQGCVAMTKEWEADNVRRSFAYRARIEQRYADQHAKRILVAAPPGNLKQKEESEGRTVFFAALSQTAATETPAGTLDYLQEYEKNIQITFSAETPAFRGGIKDAVFEILHLALEHMPELIRLEREIRIVDRPDPHCQAQFWEGQSSHRQDANLMRHRTIIA